MTIKELKADLKEATLETAKEWLDTNEKSIFFFDFVTGEIDIWEDDNWENLRDIFEAAMEKLLEDHLLKERDELLSLAGVNRKTANAVIEKLHGVKLPPKK